MRWAHTALEASRYGRSESRPHGRRSGSSRQPNQEPCKVADQVQLQLVRYDGLAGEPLQLQGIEHVLERHDGSAPRRPDSAPRRPLKDAAAYADVALAGAASAPFHPHALPD